jgi:hypothetical protein
MMVLLTKDAANNSPSPWGEGRVEGGQKNIILARFCSQLGTAKDAEDANGAPKKLESFFQSGPQPVLMLVLLGSFLEAREYRAQKNPAQPRRAARHPGAAEIRRGEAG